MGVRLDGLLIHRSCGTASIGLPVGANNRGTRNRAPVAFVTHKITKMVRGELELFVEMACQRSETLIT